ncbi:MAG: serine/threonine-protein kinase RsbW [Candidatus Omnitrophota bacterium]|jgi:serine/threonine-protein kinase RsbW
MADAPTQKVDYEVPSALAEISFGTGKLFEILAPLNLDDSNRFDIRLCFEELLINAMKHGNGLVCEVMVRITVAYNDKEVYICVTDDGPGFNPEHVKDPTVEANLNAVSGRGVFLVRHLMNEVRYGTFGSSAEILKNIHTK